MQIQATVEDQEAQWEEDSSRVKASNGMIQAVEFQNLKFKKCYASSFSFGVICLNPFTPGRAIWPNSIHLELRILQGVKHLEF